MERNVIFFIPSRMTDCVFKST